MGDSRPDVSIIITVHNDSENLVRSVESARVQSLRNLEIIIVDDCSDDDSYDVALRCAEHDARMRVLRTRANSGGPGAPRNVGIEAARAPWITFLDSDDLLDRHAAKNLLRTAEADDSDIVCGRCVRRVIADDTTKIWREKQYRVRRHVRDVREYPDIATDTISASKLYRTDFLTREGIRFIEDLRYEDMVFTAQAYTRARGISVMDETVYVWNVYPSEQRTSITNRRHEEGNLDHRLAIIERVEEVVSQPGFEQLKSVLQRKFLWHDVRLHLSDAAHLPDGDAEHALSRLEPLIRRIPWEVHASLQLIRRLLFGAALMGSVDAVREVLAFDEDGISLGGRTVRDAGAVLWAPSTTTWEAPAPGTLERRLLDLSDDPILQTPFPALLYRWHVTDVQRHPEGGALVSGELRDPLQRLCTRIEAAEATVRVTQRDTDVSFSLPVALHVLDDQRAGWKFRLELPRDVPVTPKMRFGFRVSLRVDGATNTAPLTYRCPDSRRVNIPSTAVPALREPLQFAATPSGNLGLRVVREPGVFGRIEAGVVRWVRRVRAVPNSLEVPLDTRRRRVRLIHRAARVLPLKRDVALFESHMGRSGQDSPRRVAEALRAIRPDVRIVWSHDGRALDVPVADRMVRRGSAAYLVALATAGYLVDNQSFPRYFRKRRRQVYLQTWHGIPLKKMGFDEPDVRKATEAARRALVRQAGYWDYLNVPSPYFERTFIPAYRFSGIPIAYGSPRNDPLVTEPVCPPAAVRALDLPAGRRVLLYAPTFRAAERTSRAPITLALDLDRWAEEMGEEYFLLLRAHYLTRLSVPRRFSGLCMDVSTYDDVNDLYRISDGLVTDYSSVMFDYSTLDRPVFIYAHDYANYTQAERGTYFELRDTPPGHFCTSQEELQCSIRTAWDDDESRSLRAEFRSLYCGEEPGTAAARSVAVVWEGGS